VSEGGGWPLGVEAAAACSWLAGSLSIDRRRTNERRATTRRRHRRCRRRRRWSLEFGVWSVEFGGKDEEKSEFVDVVGWGVGGWIDGWMDGWIDRRAFRIDWLLVGSLT